MLRISKIAFPGLGIGEFSIDSVAFKIGEFEIAWYAIIITFGIIFAACYTIYRTNEVGITLDDTIDFVLWTVPIGVIGARLYYVLTTLERYNSFIEIINIRNGGLAIYGGILAGAVSVFVICKVKKIPFLVMADSCTPGIIMAQAIGRWGNFTNGEAFGGPTDWFIGMNLNNSLTGYSTVCVHPTFLYESLWNLFGFFRLSYIQSHCRELGRIAYDYN